MLTVPCISTNSSNNNTSTTHHDGPFFPTGSYTFTTTLNQSSTLCTSNPATWTCGNDTAEADTTTFRWTIYGSGDNSSGLPYTVSSEGDNVFAPAFANLTAAVIDPAGPGERLVFEFDMDRSVSVPTEDLLAGVTGSNSTCTFAGSRFTATLWTGRHANDTSSSQRKASTDFDAWPAHAEIVLSKQAETGEPSCLDEDGNDIVGVQAGTGECSCSYTN